MIAVIFEVEPIEGRREEYFELAEGLKSILSGMEGFISIERFQSLTDPNRILSLSFWQNEDAIQRWRDQSSHRDAQRQGREQVFKDYRLRVAQIVRDYGMNDRTQAPGS